MNPLRLGWRINQLIVLIILAAVTGCPRQPKRVDETSQKVIDLAPEADIIVTKGKVTHSGTLCKPSENATAAFNYRWIDIAVDDEGRLYVSDGLEQCIRILSSVDGKQIQRFGAKGGGPGEFQGVGRIRVTDDKKIIVIDNSLRRATVFDRHLDVSMTIPLNLLSDDILLVDPDTAVVSGFSLERGFSPLRVIHVKTGAILRLGGTVVEPQSGIARIVESSPWARSDIHMYSHGWMTRLARVPMTEFLVLSQSHPYHVTLYDLRTLQGRTIHANVPFSTEDMQTYQVEGDSRIMTLKPSGRVLAPQVVGDRVFIPIVDSTLTENYLECYDSRGRFLERMEIPVIESVGGWHQAIAAAMSSKGVLFVLIRDPNGINWIERFEVSM